MDLFSVIKVGRALGVIIRNDQGVLLASLSKKIDLPYEEVEARAAPRVSCTSGPTPWTPSGRV